MGAILKLIFSFTIPIPIAVIPIIYGLYTASAWWDKTAAIKQAVDKRVVELVTGAEKAALEERVKAAELRAALHKSVADRERELRVSADEALRVFQETAEREALEEIKDQTNEILSSPVDPRCVVNNGTLKRLRDR